MGLMACSEALAEVQSVVLERWLLCVVMCRFLEYCTMWLVHKKSSGSKIEHRAGTHELVSALLRYLC